LITFEKKNKGHDASPLFWGARLRCNRYIAATTAAPLWIVTQAPQPFPPALYQTEIPTLGLRFFSQFITRLPRFTRADALIAPLHCQEAMATKESQLTSIEQSCSYRIRVFLRPTNISRLQDFARNNKKRKSMIASEAILGCDSRKATVSSLVLFSRESPWGTLLPWLSARRPWTRRGLLWL